MYIRHLCIIANFTYNNDHDTKSQNISFFVHHCLILSPILSICCVSSIRYYSPTVTKTYGNDRGKMIMIMMRRKTRGMTIANDSCDDDYPGVKETGIQL